MSDLDDRLTDILNGKDAPPIGQAGAPSVDAGEDDPLFSDPIFQKGKAAKPPVASTTQPTPKVTPPAASTTSEDKPAPVDTSKMDWPKYIGSTLSNVPADVKPTAQSIAEPFMHPSETFQAMGALGKGLYSKAAGALGVEQPADQKVADEAPVEATKQYFIDKYGSKEAFFQTLHDHPLQTMMDISVPFTLGETALARAPGILGDLGAASGAIGAATDPLRIATTGAGVASKALTSATALPLALKSGATLEGLNQAAAAGRTADPAFWAHWTGSAQPIELVDAVQAANSQLAKVKNDDYVTRMQGQKSFTQPLPFDQIDKALTDAQTANTTVRGAPVNRGIQEAIDATTAKINEFRNQPVNPGANSIVDLDNLKKGLDEIRSNYDFSSPQAAVITKIRQSVFNTIKNADSGYAQIMEDYANRANQLRDIRKTVLAGNNAATGSSVSKLIKAQSKGYTKNLLDQLAKIDPSIPARIAGTELNETMPIGLRGYLGSLTTQLGLGGALGSMFHPGALGALALSSPKVAGGLQYTIGALTGRPATYLQQAQKLVPAPARGALYESGKEEQIQNPKQQNAGGRRGRANGGRLNGVTTAEMLMQAMEQAKKNDTQASKPLLNLPDEAITRALAIANQIT